MPHHLASQFAPALPVRTMPLPQVVASYTRTDPGQTDSQSGATALIGASLVVNVSGLRHHQDNGEILHADILRCHHAGVELPERL